MDQYLFKHIHEQHVPKFNPILAKGLVVEQMREVEQYIDHVWKCAARSFPEGFTYDGEYKRATPEQQYAYMTRKRSSRAEFNLAPSDFYMLQYNFSYHGQKLYPRSMQLPFVGPGGVIRVNGSKYVINPVMVDNLFSVDDGKLFVALTRDKLTFERVTHNLVIDGVKETLSIPWSTIYHLRQKDKGSKIIYMGGLRLNMVSTLGHYLFCKYGVTEAFKRFCGMDVVVGDRNTITEQSHPKSDWIIVESLHLQPISVKGKGYQPTQLRVACRREQRSRLSDNLLATLFYLADHFTQRIRPEYIDDTRLWRVLMGHVIFKSKVNEGRLLEDIDAHLVSLDYYIDGLVQMNLEREGIECKDTYALFAYIIETMNEIIITTDVSNLYGKKLTTLRYILLDVIKAIFNFTFKLNSNKNKTLAVKDIEKLMDKYLKFDTIRKINTGHGEVSSLSTAGDNLMFKMTNKVVPQTDATGSRSGTKTKPSRLLHASLAEVCSYGNQPSSCPTGHGQINPYLNVTPEGEMIPDPRFTDLIESVQAKIART